MKKCFVVLAFFFAFSAVIVFAGHEILQGLIDAAKQTEQQTCASTGAVYAKYEQTEKPTRYSIETITLPSGDIYYRIMDTESLRSWAFLQRAGSSDQSQISPNEFAEREFCGKK